MYYCQWVVKYSFILRLPNYYLSQYCISLCNNEGAVRCINFMIVVFQFMNDPSPACTCTCACNGGGALLLYFHEVFINLGKVSISAIYDVIEASGPQPVVVDMGKAVVVDMGKETPVLEANRLSHYSAYPIPDCDADMATHSSKVTWAFAGALRVQFTRIPSGSDLYFGFRPSSGLIGILFCFVAVEGRALWEVWEMYTE